MKPYFSNDKVQLFHGDCRDVMRTLADESIDACVTDPPYELGFMGKRWDASGIAYDPAVWSQVFRVLKPGGHLLAFGGTRTWHRIACAIEDVGFDIRDSIAWLYGSGFPKSLDISKAIDRQRHDLDDIYLLTAWIRSARDSAGIGNADIDKAFGFHGMAGHWTSSASQPAVPTLDQIPQLLDVLGLSFDDVPDDIRTLLVDLNSPKGQPGVNWDKREIVATRAGNEFVYAPGEDKAVKRVDIDVTVAATEAAATWAGWGTALKPAHEPVVVARKPLVGTVAANVQTYGTGGLNIDACRIGTEGGTQGAGQGPQGAVYGDGLNGTFGEPVPGLGRWPANVICDEHAAAEIDRQSGTTVAQPYDLKRGATTGRSIGGTATYGTADPHETTVGYDDQGGASRFFYIPKADRKQRPKTDDGTQHPTVKPLDLIRHLVRLVTPPGGTVLDPFAGSGTTAEACLIEHFACVTIELTPDYLPLIEARLSKPIQPTLGGDL